jgi:hypothetical protein
LEKQNFLAQKITNTPKANRSRKYKKIISLSLFLMALLVGSLSSGLTVSLTHAASTHDLGVWYIPDWANNVPSDTKWICAETPVQASYAQFPSTAQVILNDLQIHKPWDSSQSDGVNGFKTAADLNGAESKLKALPLSKFWGILFIAEEHFKYNVKFNDNLDTTWFGERMLGYPLYLQTNPGATQNQWKDEMFLRMVRGFYTYFHGSTKIGMTAGNPCFMTRSYVDYLDYYFGYPAFNYIRQNFDFMVFYAYTTNLDNFNGNLVKDYFLKIDQYFGNQKQFWLLTRTWTDFNIQMQPEAIALEIKNALDRGMPILSQWDSDPPLSTMWPYIQKSIQLYDSGAPYYETYVSGTNLLTGTVGNTYGWVSTTSPTPTPSPTSTPSPTPTPSPSPGTLFADGFESGNSNSWSGTQGAPTVSSAVMQQGSYSAYFDTKPETVYKAFSSAYSTVYTRFYVRFSTLPTTNGGYNIFMNSYDSSWNTQYNCYVINSGGQLKWGIRAPTSGFVEVAATITPNTWYSVEVRSTTGTGNGILELYINGNRITNLATQTFTLGAQRFYYGVLDASYTGFGNYIDNVAISNSYIGP